MGRQVQGHEPTDSAEDPTRLTSMPVDVSRFEKNCSASFLVLLPNKEPVHGQISLDHDLRIRELATEALREKSILLSAESQFPRIPPRSFSSSSAPAVAFGFPLASTPGSFGA